MRKSEELSNPNSCMSRARPDEMTFVLLGRDVTAPTVIREWCRLRIKSGKNLPGDQQILEAAHCADVMESERVTSDYASLQQAAREIANHCPCGARPESPATHPHVPGCPVYKLLKLLNLPAVSVGDQYEKAVDREPVTAPERRDAGICFRHSNHTGPCNGTPRADCPRFTGSYDTSTGTGCDECGNTHGDAHSPTCKRGKA